MAKRFIAILLSISIVLSLSLSAFAAEDNTDSGVMSVSSLDELKAMDFDAPVIAIRGFGLGIYKGLSTATEEDDEALADFSSIDITELLKKYGFSLVGALFTKNYDVLADVLSESVDPLFGAMACDGNGDPDPDTGIKTSSDIAYPCAYGYENYFEFNYDWRLDMHTLACQLDSYIEYVMKATGAEQVVLTGFSMGANILMTYLYEHYYTQHESGHIKAVLIMSGAVNGVPLCADPLSGNVTVDATSLMRYLAQTMAGNENTKTIYSLLEMLYSLGVIDIIADYLNTLVQGICENALNEVALNSLGTLPGLYSLMSQEQYEASEAYIFDTPEKRAEYAGLIEKNRYYHDCVQPNINNIIDSLLADGINTAIVAEYGYACIPVTGDNDAMADGIITTSAESFGATCADIDGTLGANYVQAKECECGKNHVSPDNQIDASTCAYPDITWFAKGLYHNYNARYLADIVDAVAYSDKQITVWDYEELPQFLINENDERLVPMTSENAGTVVSYDEGLSNIVAIYKKLAG